MKIKYCELTNVLGLTSKIPKNNLKEFVLCGRSNVGKSSFINALINRNNYARVSQVPGKTRTINYYNINNEFYLVDLPGYGYAKASTKEINDWAKLINKYFKTSGSIEEIIMIVDIRHIPTKDDIKMYNFILDNTGYEPIVIMTKLDKIKRSQIVKNTKLIKDTFKASENAMFIPFSSTEKVGVEEVLKIFDKILN